MPSNSSRRHLFISHHHKDDGIVDKFTSLLGRRNGWDVRNSSIRAKPANQARLDRGLVKAEVIKRLLRRKISWSSTVVVLIGSHTHSRPWVNWEIDQAHAQGKKIIGVYERGGTDRDIPPSLEKYASAIIAWNSESIRRAIDQGEIRFESPDGTLRPPKHSPTTSSC